MLGSHKTTHSAKIFWDPQNVSDPFHHLQLTRVVYESTQQVSFTLKERETLHLE